MVLQSACKRKKNESSAQVFWKGAEVLNDEQILFKLLFTYYTLD